MIAEQKTIDTWLADFERFEQSHGHGRLARLRRSARERFAKLGLPSSKDEEWRFTPLTRLLGQSFRIAPLDDRERDAESYRRLLHGERPGTTLLAANGIAPFILHGSDPLPTGVIVCGLAEAIERHRSLVEPHLGRYADYEDHFFTALNTAFVRDGAFVYVPPNTVVTEPIYVHFLVAAWNDDCPYAWQRRTLIVCGEGSRATIVEDYSGSSGQVYFTNAVTEAVVAENAGLDHCRLERDGNKACHIATVQVQQSRRSQYTSYAISNGGELARTDLNVIMEAENCEATLNGLYVATGDQLIDHHTRVDHAKPRCASHELYKGILDGRAHGVFNGKVVVHQDAQKTDAKQTNRTLLLSDDAVIDAKPQLEIYADDVKCTHGASIGQLDDEQIFYLRSRGIDVRAARGLLTFAFANEIVQRIPVDALRGALEAQLSALSPGLRTDPENAR